MPTFEFVLRFAAALSGFVAFGMFLVLPGFSLRRFFAGHDHGTDLPGEVGAAAAASLLLWATVPGMLIAAGIFRPGAAVAAGAALALLGLPGAVRYVRELRTAGLVLPMAGGFAWLLLLSLPYLALSTSATVHALPPFPWYYWNLAREMAEAGGVPQSTTEYGMALRWLPDYVLFHGLTVAYRGALAVFGDVRAISAFVWPVALLGLYAAASVLSLWVGWRRGLVLAPLVGMSTLYRSEFNAYKPEGIAIALGLWAVWLLVTGLRARRGTRIVLGGCVIGLDLGVHAIAATAVAVLMVSAGIVEGIGRRRRRAWSVACLAAGAAAAVAWMLAVGAGLQGRLSVVADAAHPRIVRGRDLTWEFLRLDAGVPPQRVLGRPPDFEAQLARAVERVTTPWPGVDLAQWPFGYLGLAVAVGAAAAVCIGCARCRRGVAAVLGFAAGLFGLMAFFALFFDTYVPKHTGLGRFSQYVPLAWALLAAVAVVGWGQMLHVVFRAFGRRLGRDRWNRRLPPLMLLVWTAAMDDAGRPDAPIRPGAYEAWGYVMRNAGPDDPVLYNVHTSGLMEFFTGVECPLEGRQPLIEPTFVLSRAVDLYAMAHRFFRNGGRDPKILDELGVRYVVVARRPKVFGEKRSFGGRPASLRRSPHLEEVWRGRDVVVFRSRRKMEPAARSVARPRITAARYGAALAGAWGLSLGLFWLGARAWGRRSGGAPSRGA